jgi:hypothetical protein
MNTQARVQRLEAGQALPLPSNNRSPAILSEGELLVQAPATWLGETLVVPPPVRLVAPAVLPSGRSCSFVAVHASTVVLPRPVPLFPFTRWLAAAAWLPRHLRRRVFHRERLAA